MTMKELNESITRANEILQKARAKYDEALTEYRMLIMRKHVGIINYSIENGKIVDVLYRSSYYPVLKAEMPDKIKMTTNGIDTKIKVTYCDRNGKEVTRDIDYFNVNIH